MKEINPKFVALTSYYNDSGEMIGDREIAELLTEMGIEPTLREGNTRICSIGFCEREQKWYGWSHRAMCGFGIGDRVKKGDRAYHAANKEDFIERAKDFWNEPFNSAVWVEEDEDGKGFYVRWRYSNDVPNKDIRGGTGEIHYEFPAVYGRGEWTAETLDDCRRMAEDFADGMS